MRFWRNTSVATLAPGAFATLPIGTLGYEWDEDRDNGFRPPGLMRLSDTTVSGVDYLQDFGSTYGPARPTTRSRSTVTRAARWCSAPARSSGRGASTAITTAGSGAKPGDAAGDGEPVRRHGRATADASARAQCRRPLRRTPPRRPRRSPRRRTVRACPPITLSRFPARPRTLAAEPSPASRCPSMAARRGSAQPAANLDLFMADGSAARTSTIFSRAIDDSGNLEQPGTRDHRDGGVGTVACPCSIWTSRAGADRCPPTHDRTPVELGTRFRSDVDGYITGDPLLQDSSERRNAYRQSLDPERRAAGHGDVLGRDAPPAGRKRLSRHRSRSRRTHATSSPTTRPPASTPATTATLRTRRRQRAASRRAGREGGANGVYRVRCQWLPDRDVRKRELLGRRRVLTARSLRTRRHRPFQRVDSDVQARPG